MKVFLTGGTGFIGQSLTECLLARNWQVIALVRKPDSFQTRNLASKGAQCVVGDVTDRESMRAPMTGADIVIHNAGHYEYGVDAKGRHRMKAINLDGTDNTLGLALELGVPRAVYVSSVVAFGDTGSQMRDETFVRQAPCRTYYEQTKTEAHQIAQGYAERGLPLIIVCPNGVVGPNDHSAFGYLLRMYLNNLLPPYAWAPDIVITLVQVDDLAEGIALAAEKGRLGETYFLAGEPHRRRDYIGWWNEKPGGFKVRFYVPAWVEWFSFILLEPLQRWAGMPAVVSRETVMASFPLNMSSAKAQRELGWTYRPAKEMWLEIIDQELELLAQRKKRDLVSRLKPMEMGSH
jgi:dihydroflavonol-4-reductase